MTERALRVAPYYRVSTEEQRKHGYSLADQRRELRSEAAKCGWQVVEEIADEGRSGADPYRPGFARVMELARAGEMISRSLSTVSVGSGISTLGEASSGNSGATGSKSGP